MESDSDNDIFITQSHYRDASDYDTEDAADACLELETEFGIVPEALEATSGSIFECADRTSPYSDISDVEETVCPPLSEKPAENPTHATGQQGPAPRFAEAKTDEEMETLGRRRWVSELTYAESSIYVYVAWYFKA